MSENQITRLFENHPIFILKEVDVNNKNQFYFKASDVGKVVDIVNIRQSIHQFDEDERCVMIRYFSLLKNNNDKKSDFFSIYNEFRQNTGNFHKILR